MTTEQGIVTRVAGARRAGTPTGRLTTSAYVVAGAATLVLLAFSTRYGPHRDELYFIAAGHHPQWGYPDQPPLTPLVAAAADLVAPGSLFVLRLLSAVLVGVIMLVTADLARALGGGRGAQLLAAVTTATGGGVLAIGHLLSTATLDLALWTVVIRLVVGVLQRDEPRGWLLVGAVLGLGLENKHLIAFLAAGLVIGIAVTPTLRHHLRSPWAWGGAAIALALWAPNLLWQAGHGWPQGELAADVRDEYRTPGGTAQLVGFQALLLNPLGAFLAATGLVATFRRPGWAFFRPVPVAYLVLLPAFVLLGGAARAHPGHLLLPRAQRGRAGDDRLAARRRAGARGRRIATSRSTTNCGRRDEQLRRGRCPSVVRRFAARLQRPQRVRRLGPAHQPGAGRLRRCRAPPSDALTGCRPAATLHTGVGNEEDGNGVWVCTGPTGSWSRAWPKLRHLSA